MDGVRDKFGVLLDEAVESEESKRAEVPRLYEGKIKAQSVTRPSTSSSPSPTLGTKEEKTFVPSVAVRSDVTIPPLHEQPKVAERVIVPFLNDVKVLEKCPEKDRKFLEMFDGTLSLRGIANRLGVPFFDVLQVATKYKNMGKVDMKEIIRG
jgi:hypothetical protein